MQAKFEETLADAIHSKRLRIVLSELKENSAALPVNDQRKLEAAVTAVKTIDDSTRLEMQSVCDLLERNGVSVLSSTSDSEEIVHLFHVSVDKSELEDAVRLLEEDGYFTPLRKCQSFWRRYKRFFHRAHFSCNKQLPFRIALSWQSGDKAPGKLSRMLQPSVDDLKYVKIPSVLWPAYYGVKFVRRIFKKSSRETVQNLGPFLGTPEGMIEPLLRFADLQSDHQLIDIGCGDGRILLKAAVEFGCRVVGYETDDSLLQLARRKVKEQGCEDLVTLSLVDANQADVSKADVIFVFLPASVIDGMVTKLLPKMKAAAVLIAHEQHELKTSAKPIQRMPLILPCGISVAYKWQA